MDKTVSFDNEIVCEDYEYIVLLKRYSALGKKEVRYSIVKEIVEQWLEGCKKDTVSSFSCIDSDAKYDFLMYAGQYMRNAQIELQIESNKKMIIPVFSFFAQEETDEIKSIGFLLNSQFKNNTEEEIIEVILSVMEAIDNQAEELEKQKFLEEREDRVSY